VLSERSSKAWGDAKERRAQGSRSERQVGSRIN
jgi:hypothetical protein